MEPEKKRPIEHRRLSIGPRANTARCSCGYVHPDENGKMETGWTTDGKHFAPLTLFCGHLETDSMF